MPGIGHDPDPRHSEYKNRSVQICIGPYSAEWNCSYAFFHRERIFACMDHKQPVKTKNFGSALHRVRNVRCNGPFKLKSETLSVFDDEQIQLSAGMGTPKKTHFRQGA